MIKLTPYVINSPKCPVIQRKAFKGSDVTDILIKGDKALNENQYGEALKYYSEAKSQNPDEISVYKKMGKAYAGLKDYKRAQENFAKYLEKNPDDAEILIELGNAQHKSGLYKYAAESYKKALSLDEKNDLAKRCLMEVENDTLALYSPEKARKEKSEYAGNNLRTALELATSYLGNEYMKDLANVEIRFGQTASMGGTANIAQYENNKKGITVSAQYMYAAPQVIAAYLVHESVHAKDKDAYTSVREEQDAYALAAKFWIKNSKGVKDPEMDYAAGLYKSSPRKLSERVEEIYTLRDPDIAKTSPNHPPKQKTSFLTKSKAASQSLRQYDTIA